jgi:hypothetical protein
MAQPELLVCAIALAGLVTCGHDPAPVPLVPPTAAPTMPTKAPRPATPARPGLAQACDDGRPCAEGLTCRRPCADALADDAPDACMPSTVAFCDAGARRRSLAPEELVLVLSAGGLHGVLGRVADASVLTEGEVRALAVTDEALVVGRRAPAERVPPASQALVGRRFAVMGEAGRICEAEVTGLSLVGLEPRAAGPEAPSHAVSVGARVDAAALQYSRHHGAVYLAATLHADAECEGAVWARASELPEVPAAVAREARGRERRAALASYRELAPYRAHLERFRSDRGDPIASDWTSYREGGGFGPEVLAFTLAGHHHVVVAARVGDVCAGYVAALLVALHADDDDLRVGALAWDSALRPRIALDLDGDGELELIEHEGTRAQLWSPTLETTSGFATAMPSTGC